VDTEISVADAWEYWNDRERIPRWMKWIDTVTVLHSILLVGLASFDFFVAKYRAAYVILLVTSNPL